MKVTKQQFDCLKEAAKFNLCEQAKVYGLTVGRYCERVLQDTLEKAIEWEMCRIAYGGELSPNAGISCA